MSSTPELKLDWCSHEAADYAVKHWHYSRRMPKSKLAKIGVWEAGNFIGVVIFGVGATYTIGMPYQLPKDQVCELVRVALRKHAASVSKILSIAIKLLRKFAPGLRLIVSYADTLQNHCGSIYQAGNWIYVGADEDSILRIHGTLIHRRSAYDSYGTSSLREIRERVDSKAERVASGLKHKYVMPLDVKMRDRILPLARPYPKRVTSDTIDMAAVHADEGGETPTVTLQRSA